MTLGHLQLIAISEQDDITIKNPSITFFKKVYKSHPLFFKDENENLDIELDWGNNYKYTINEELQLLGNMFLKVRIPYFKVLKNTTTTTANISSNQIITKLLYDNYETYIFTVKEGSDINYFVIDDVLIYFQRRGFTSVFVIKISNCKLTKNGSSKRE